MHRWCGQMCHAGQMSMCWQMIGLSPFMVPDNDMATSSIQRRLLKLLSFCVNVTLILHNILTELHWLPVYTRLHPVQTRLPDTRGRSHIHQTPWRQLFGIRIGYASPAPLTTTKVVRPYSRPPTKIHLGVFSPDPPVFSSLNSFPLLPFSLLFLSPQVAPHIQLKDFGERC